MASRPGPRFSRPTRCSPPWMIPRCIAAWARSSPSALRAVCAKRASVPRSRAVGPAGSAAAHRLSVRRFQPARHVAAARGRDWKRMTANAFEVFAYDYSPEDATPIRARMRAAFEHFVSLGDQPPAACAALIAADDIDILVDLKGYTERSRSEIMVLRAGPRAGTVPRLCRHAGRRLDRLCHRRRLRAARGPAGQLDRARGAHAGELLSQ